MNIGPQPVYIVLYNIDKRIAHEALHQDAVLAFYEHDINALSPSDITQQTLTSSKTVFIPGSG